MNNVFSIFKFDKNQANQVINSPNTAHQHLYEELIIGKTGHLKHFIDFETKFYQSPFISFVSKGKMHRVEPILENGECEFWVLRFQSEFISDITFQLYQHYHQESTLQLKHSNNFDRIVQLTQLIYQESTQETSNINIIRQLLITIFTCLEHERATLQNSKTIFLIEQDTTYKNLIAILEENFRRPLGVNYYAEKLFMSTRNLNKITQNILNKTVTELIENRKLIEAKHLLINTNKTISEIGYEIGYTDKAYFTHVFKKKTGITPSEFRSENCILDAK